MDAATRMHQRWKFDHSISGDQSADVARTCRASNVVVSLAWSGYTQHVPEKACKARTLEARGVRYESIVARTVTPFVLLRASAGRPQRLGARAHLVCCAYLPRPRSNRRQSGRTRSTSILLAWSICSTGMSPEPPAARCRGYRAARTRRRMVTDAVTHAVTHACV